jgi:dolichol-phosphate mannosyltransferase
MRRCLITGASGFVGANLARRLLWDGYETHVLLRPGHQSWRLIDIAASLHAHKADLTDQEAIHRTVELVRPDWVFHLAAYGAYSSQTGFARMADVNLTGTAALLDACAARGVEAFIYTGSSSEYGYKNHAPREDELLEPNSHYAITKAAATHYCQFTARRSGVNAIVVRLYSIYGPYEEPSRLIPTLIAYGLQGQLPPLVSPAVARDFVHVDDAVDGLIALAQSVRPGAIYNLCTGVQTSMATVVETARKLIGIAVEPVWSSMEQRSWDTDIWVGSPDALEKDVGWRARIDFTAGLQRTIDWFHHAPGTGLSPGLPKVITTSVPKSSNL